MVSEETRAGRLQALDEAPLLGALDDGEEGGAHHQEAHVARGEEGQPQDAPARVAHLRERERADIERKDTL